MWVPQLSLRPGMRNLPFMEDPPVEENAWIKTYFLHNTVQTLAAPVQDAHLECNFKQM